MRRLGIRVPAIHSFEKLECTTPHHPPSFSDIHDPDPQEDHSNVSKARATQIASCAVCMLIRGCCRKSAFSFSMVMSLVMAAILKGKK